jgi:predicted ATPase
MIEKQLERLTPEEQRVLEAASVVGGECTTAALAAGLAEPLESVEARCEELAKRDQFLRAQRTETLADGTVTGRYGFLHALYQQVLYERLTDVRRVHLHRRVGEWEERARGARAADVAAELAMHFERGQDHERAIRHLAQAGHNALRRSAHPEAIRLLTRGRELLAALPETQDRDPLELGLQATLGATLAVTKGYAATEVRDAYERAFELCQKLDAASQDFSVLGGLWTFRFLRAEMRTAERLAMRLFELAQAAPDPALLLWSHIVQGMTSATLGDLPFALEHLEKGVALYDPQSHRPDRIRVGPQDPKTTCLAYAAWTLWRSGYPDRARQKVDEVLAFARDLSHPFSLAFALDFAGAGVHIFLRDARVVQACTEELMELCREESFPYWLAWGTVRRGWVLVERGRVEEGIAEIRQGMDAVRITGAELSLLYVLAQLAEAYGKLGRVDEGLSLLDEALALADRTGERWYDAELHRLRGELTLERSRVPRSVEPSPAEVEREATSCLLKAVEIARRQEAKSFELRATVSLARLWDRQGKRDEARTTLAAIYGWFTEGFDTWDLREADALLQELSATRR